MSTRKIQYVGRRPPPVAQRPTCRYCGKRLRPDIEHHWPGTSTTEPVTYEWTGAYGYRGEGKFCTLLCGYWWAMRHVK